MAKVLVTGASGFIGPHLVRFLMEQGSEVICLVRSTSHLDRLEPLEPRIVSGDVTNPASLASLVAGVDVVYHLAGTIKALRRPDFLHVNETGVANMIEACCRSETPPVFVLASSLSAAGPSPNGRLRDERDPSSPVSNYGISKRAGELIAEKWAARLPISIVRPPIVFGEGDPEFLAMMRPVAQHGFHLVPTLAEHRFSLIHAADLADALVVIAQRAARLPSPDQQAPTPGQGYYFAAYDEHPTYAQLGHLIAESVGRTRARVLYAPEFVTWSVVSMFEAVSQIRRRPSILGLDKAREATAGSWTCSPDKLHGETGFAPAGKLSDRLRTTADWYRREGWL